MKKISLLISIGFVLCFLSQFGVSQSSDNSDLRKLEIGGHFTYLGRRLPDRMSSIPPSFPGIFGFRETDATATNLGLGARFTFNLHRNVAVEAEYNFFPDNRNLVLGASLGPPRFEGFGIVPGPRPRATDTAGRKHQVVFGPKIGYRGRKIGVFGKVRPGFITLDRYLVVKTLVATPNSVSFSVRLENNHRFLNVDIGGVFEYYPTRRTVIRVDVGDSIIRYGDKEPKALNPPLVRHNLQTNIGFGFRF